MDIKKDFIKDGVFVGRDNLDDAYFNAALDSDKAFMAAGLLDRVSHLSIKKAWLDTCDITDKFSGLVFQICRERKITCPWDQKAIPVSEDIHANAMRWVKANFKPTDPSSFVGQSNCLRTGYGINEDLRTFIFDIIPEPMRAFLWLTTLPTDPDQVIATAKAISADRAESARKAFVAAARANQITHPKYRSRINLKIEDLRVLRGWYFRQPEAVVIFTVCSFLREKSSEQSDAVGVLHPGNEIRIISGPHEGTWYKCRVKNANPDCAGKIGFVQLTQDMLKHDTGEQCVMSLMDGAQLPDEESIQLSIAANALKSTPDKLDQMRALMKKLEAENNTSGNDFSIEIANLQKSMQKLTYESSSSGAYATDKITASQAMIKQLEEAVKALRVEIDAKNASIKALSDSLEIEKARTMSAESDLQSEILSKIQVSKKLEISEKAYSDLCVINIGLKESHDRYAGESEKQIRGLQATLSDLRNQNSNLSDKLSKLFESLDLELSRTSSLMAMVKEKDASISTMAGAISALRSQLDISEHKYDGIKSDISEASWRVAASQLVKIVREPIAALIMRHLGEDDDSMRAKIGVFIKTDLGYAFIASMLSVGVSSLGDTEISRLLSRELRVSAMAEASDVVADIIAEPLRRIICEVLSNNKATSVADKLLPNPEHVNDFIGTNVEAENVIV